MASQQALVWQNCASIGKLGLVWGHHVAVHGEFWHFTLNFMLYVQGC
jgi:hypothetical protein